MTSFWRKDNPVISEETGAVLVGGMFPTQRELWESPAYVKAFIGGYGCVRGDTLISTDKGMIRMDCLRMGDNVLSYDSEADEYVFAMCSGSYLKGKAKLYEITTREGSFTASGHHRMLCGDRTYQFVRDLTEGQQLVSATRPPTVPIERITRHSKVEAYWDTTVAGTHNYVTIDGCVHHNSGKSMLLCKRAISLALENAPVPVMIISPSYRMAKRTVLLALCSLLEGRKINFAYNKTDSYFTLRYKGRIATVFIGSAEIPQTLKGSNLAAVLIDEAYMCSWETIEIALSRIRDPASVHRELLLAGTPEESISTWAQDMLYGDTKKNYDISVHEASTLENKALPPEFVESLLAAYSEDARDAYIYGKFSNVKKGRLYSSFDKATMVNRKPLPKDPTIEICAGLDMNVDPFCGVLFWVIEGHMHIFDEIHITGGCDTWGACDALFKKNKNLSVFYPDPSCIQRKTSARHGTTDATIIQTSGDRLRGAHFALRAARRTPPLKDRWNSVNNLCRQNRLTVDPKCVETIKSLTQSTYAGFKKKDGLDHQADALGYRIALEDPLRNKVKELRKWY